MTKKQFPVLHKNPVFTIKRSKQDSKFYWVLTSSNGRSILRSIKGFKTKQNAEKNIALVLQHGTDAKKYDYETANIKGNGYYFWLIGRKYNSKLAISGNGKNYNSLNWQVAEMGYKKGIASCQANLKRIKAKIENNENWLNDKTTDKRKKAR